MVFRGSVLESADFAKLQRLIDSRPGQSRQEIARQACRMFRWRRANGVWATRAARQVLVRLDAAGLIGLPPARRPQGRPHRHALEMAARLGGPAAAATETASQVRAGATLLVRPISAEEQHGWRAHMQRFHYLGDAPVVGESLRYAAYLDGELVALLSWGAAALHNGPRDRYLGWDAATKRTQLHLVVNNARFLLLPWIRQPHLASRVLGRTLRRLSRDWEHAYGHPVVLAETFVDPARFRGTCYRASNWLWVGETAGWAKRGRTYRFHGQPKAVWLYPLRPDFKTQLCTRPSGRPREEGLMAIQVEKLPLHGQGGLFDVLCGVPEPRKARGLRHQIQSVLAAAVCATLAGARSMTAIAEWAAEQSRETLMRLGSTRGRPPSERTFRRVLHLVDVGELDRRTGQWMAQQQQRMAGQGLALDGKTVRGSRNEAGQALHLLSAITHGEGTVVAQVAVDAKTNEITHVEPLLKDLDIKGAVVTADALLTQTAIARHVVQDKGADYVFTVKDNQPTLRQDIATLQLDAFPPSGHDGR